MRWLLTITLIISAIIAVSWLAANQPLVLSSPVVRTEKKVPIKSDETKTEFFRLKDLGNTLEVYAKKNNFNSRYCFLVDMKLPSGSKRFFIYDIKNDSVVASGLVAHGSGSDNEGKDLVFSNAINSNCTSIGKYKIGNSYTGKFGLAYKLHGLDKTNSNAFNRFVVLHSHSCVPEDEVAPAEICRSWGCPTVAPAFLLQLKKYLDESDKPILLQIFY